MSHCISKILPVNRRILKPEIYRTKTMVEQAVLHLGRQLELNIQDPSNVYPAEDMAHDLGIFLQLYASIIGMDVVDSSNTILAQTRPTLANDPEPHTRVCDYCHCDIWNSWFHCDKCVPGTGHDFCANCLAENRKCLHYRDLTWLCHRPVEACLEDLKHASQQYNAFRLRSSVKAIAPVPVYSTLR